MVIMVDVGFVEPLDSQSIVETPQKWAGCRATALVAALKKSDQCSRFCTNGTIWMDIQKPISHHWLFVHPPPSPHIVWPAHPLHILHNPKRGVHMPDRLGQGVSVHLPVIFLGPPWNQLAATPSNIREQIKSWNNSPAIVTVSRNVFDPCFHLLWNAVPGTKCCIEFDKLWVTGWCESKSPNNLEVLNWHNKGRNNSYFHMLLLVKEKQCSAPQP